MTKTITTDQVIAAEDRLLSALLKSDLETINELLHDDLLFVIPTGQVITKEMDLENYHSGNMKVDGLEAFEQEISMFDETAIVTVTIQLKGTFMDQPIDGTYRYLRNWKRFGDGLQVIGGAAVQVMET